MLAGTCEEQTEAAGTPLAQSCSVVVPQTLYFVTCRKPSYPIKIGVTSKLRLRMAQLKTGAPYDLVLFYAMSSDGRSFEQELHREFAGSRLNGEWFKRSDMLMKLLRGMRQDFPAWRHAVGLGPNEYR